MSDMTVQDLAGLQDQASGGPTLWHRMRTAWQQHAQAKILGHVDDRLRSDAGLPRGPAATPGFTITTCAWNVALLPRERTE